MYKYNDVLSNLFVYLETILNKLIFQ